MKIRETMALRFMMWILVNDKVNKVLEGYKWPVQQACTLPFTGQIGNDIVKRYRSCFDKFLPSNIQPKNVYPSYYLSTLFVKYKVADENTV